MYTVKEYKFGKNKRIVLMNNDTKEYVSILPFFGANVNEIVLKKSNTLYNLIEGYKTEEEVLANKGSKSAKLIPFPNRIKDGKYTFLKKEYSLPINKPKENNSIHGLLFNKHFKIKQIEKTNSFAQVTLKYFYNKELPGYPFKFTITITYTLSENGFTSNTKITNNSSQKIPIGDGWHPYLKTEGIIDDLYLKLPSNKYIVVDDRMIPTGKINNYPKFKKLSKIGNTLFDTGFVIENQEQAKLKNKKAQTTAATSAVTKTILKDKTKNFTITVWQDEKYKFLQVYIPASRNSIAIEPMTCAVNAFNNKMGLIILKSHETFSADYGIYIK